MAASPLPLPPSRSRPTRACARSCTTRTPSSPCPVKRGVVTLVALDADEAITEVAAGLGGDCAKAEAAWCVAAQPGGRNLFVKAKSTASAPNNLAVVTDRRTHSFRFVVLADGDPDATGVPARRQGPRASCGTAGTPRACVTWRRSWHSRWCRHRRRRNRSSPSACRPSRR